MVVKSDRRRRPAPLPRGRRRGRLPGPVAAGRARLRRRGRLAAPRRRGASTRSTASSGRARRSRCCRPSGGGSSDGRGRRPPRPATATRRPRTARLNELLREVVAEELTPHRRRAARAGDVTPIDVDADLNRAIVYFDSLAGEAGDAAVLEALAGHRRAAAGGDRPPDPRPQDAGARLPARRGDPLGRAHRGDPARGPAGGATRARRSAVGPPTGPRPVRRRQAGRHDEPRRRGGVPRGRSASAGSATPARSTPTPPACCSSASAR